MALVPLVAFSHFEFQFSLPPLEAVVGVRDPFFTAGPVKPYRRPTRKRGRRDDKTIKKLPSAFYFAHESLGGKQYPKRKLTCTGMYLRLAGTYLKLATYILNIAACRQRRR